MTNEVFLLLCLKIQSLPISPKMETFVSTTPKFGILFTDVTRSTKSYPFWHFLLQDRLHASQSLWNTSMPIQPGHETCSVIKRVSGLLHSVSSSRALCAGRPSFLSNVVQRLQSFSSGICWLS